MLAKTTLAIPKQSYYFFCNTKTKNLRQEQKLLSSSKAFAASWHLVNWLAFKIVQWWR
jgi:hypothetical protein